MWQQDVDVVDRFIPACVGNSIKIGIQVSFLTVHPRVCGELAHGFLNAYYNAGSSPRVWGTHMAGT